jgi:fluoride ion exporter CrcB/FEX
MEQTTMVEPPMNPVFAATATLLVAVGGALGSVARYWMAVGVARFAGETFPWGTLFINIIGSFVISYFGTMTLPDGVGPRAWRCGCS